jgi:hypothetical protein
VDALKQIQAGRPTTGHDLDATWKLMWSTEKVLQCAARAGKMCTSHATSNRFAYIYAEVRMQETQFIVKNAQLFGTQTGDIYQVISTFLRSLLVWQLVHVLEACNTMCHTLLAGDRYAPEESAKCDHLSAQWNVSRRVEHKPGARQPADKLSIHCSIFDHQPAEVWRSAIWERLVRMFLGPCRTFTGCFMGFAFHDAIDILCRFDSVYMDERIRCARDIRGDTLVVRQHYVPLLGP